MDYFYATNSWDVPCGLSDGEDTWIKLELTPTHATGRGWWSGTGPSPVTEPYMPLELLCRGCHLYQKQCYREGWFCVNSDCPNWFYYRDSRPAPETVTLSEHFIQSRNLRIGLPHALSPLVPSETALIEVFRDQATDILERSGVMLLSRGHVCLSCRRCICRISFRGFSCPDCFEYFQSGPGASEVESAVTQTGLYGNGVPHSPIICGYGYNETEILPDGPSTLRVNRIPLQGEAAVIAFTPSTDWNRSITNMDELWTDLHHNIVYADPGAMNLARTLVRPESPQDGILTGFYHETYGERYNFGPDRPPADMYVGPDLLTKPKSIRHVELILGNLLTGRIPTLNVNFGASRFANPGLFNSTQVIGYLPGMELPWHTDGDQDELGPFSALLQLGGDAELRIRLRNEEHEIVIPLLHGSMVMFLGHIFSQSYEVCVHSPGVPSTNHKTLLTIWTPKSTRSRLPARSA